jgi:cation diffusion facilitator family transporter
MTSSQSENYKITRKVTLVGSVIDGLLSLLKISIGIIGQSQALIVDGVHSLSDLATDVMVIWAAKHAQAEPDAEHPYGHKRIETLATMALSLALIAVAIGFAYDAVTHLIAGTNLQQPGWMVLIAAAISMLAKEWICRYTLRAARLINSDLLRANAWHSRSDAASSLIVLFGVLGAMAGFAYADALAAIGVSIMIGWVGWTLGRQGTAELIDTSVEPEVLNKIIDTIRSVEGVTDVHQTRTRKMAGNIVMDSHITVNPNISVSEGHRIGDAVEAALHAQFTELSDITVHIDHEDDASDRPDYHLPLRNQVLEDIRQTIVANKTELDYLNMHDFVDIKLHYVGGRVQLELWFDKSDLKSRKMTNQIESNLIQNLKNIEYINAVELLYRTTPVET